MHLWSPLTTGALGIGEQILLQVILMLLFLRYPPDKSEKVIPISSPAHPQETSWEKPVSDPWSLLEGK